MNFTAARYGSRAGMVKYPLFDNHRGYFAMSVTQEAAVRKRVSPTPETRRKLSAALKDRVPPKSERLNISKSKTGIPKSEESKAKMSEAKKGKTASDETKEAITLSLRDHYKLGQMGREARFMTAIATGQSVKTAAQTVGLDHDTAYKLAQNEQFRLAIIEASMHIRAALYEDMPEMLALSKKVLMDTMRSPTARAEVKVKAAAHVQSLAIFLASADKGFQPPPPDQEDLDLIVGQAVQE